MDEGVEWGKSRLSSFLARENMTNVWCSVGWLMGKWRKNRWWWLILIHIIECRVLPWPTGATNPNPKVPNSQQNEIASSFIKAFCWPFEKFLTENVDGKKWKRGKSVEKMDTFSSIEIENGIGQVLNNKNVKVFSGIMKVDRIFSIQLPFFHYF